MRLVSYRAVRIQGSNKSILIDSILTILYRHSYGTYISAEDIVFGYMQANQLPQKRQRAYIQLLPPILRAIYCQLPSRIQIRQRIPPFFIQGLQRGLRSILVSVSSRRPTYDSNSCLRREALFYTKLLCTSLILEQYTVIDVGRRNQALPSLGRLPLFTTTSSSLLPSPSSLLLSLLSVVRRLAAIFSFS